MAKHSEMTRRTAMTALAGAAAAGLAAPAVAQEGDTSVKGNLKQSVCKWCYRKQSLDELCEAAAGIGIQAIDLLSAGVLPTEQLITHRLPLEKAQKGFDLVVQAEDSIKVVLQP